jgi:hypothetical protein
MSSILPVGLTHLVPSDGTLVPISNSDITTSSGTVGPLILNVANPSTSVSALFSYSAELDPVPQPPQYFTNVPLVAIPNDREAVVDITVIPGKSITVTNIVSSTNNWAPVNWNTGKVLGNAIGGATPANDINFIDSAVNENGSAAAFAYYSGAIPGTPPAPTANAPILGTPTKVFTIPPLSNQIIQIPSSSASLSTGPIDLIASGANLYVTPVQII